MIRKYRGFWRRAIVHLSILAALLPVWVVVSEVVYPERSLSRHTIAFALVYLALYFQFAALKIAASVKDPLNVSLAAMKQMLVVVIMTIIIPAYFRVPPLRDEVRLAIWLGTAATLPFVYAGLGWKEERIRRLVKLRAIERIQAAAIADRARDKMDPRT